MDTSAREEARKVVDHHIARATEWHVKLTGLSGLLLRPSDVFIVSFMKSGTTLMQNALYQLLCLSGRVPTDPEGEGFEDISEVVPFAEVRHVLNVHDSIHPYTPRLWKSHSEESVFTKAQISTGKFVYCMREGRQVARSYLDFALDWLAEYQVSDENVRKLIYEQFFVRCFLGFERNGDAWKPLGSPLYNWFAHVNAWVRSERKVLFLFFDEIINDLQGTLDKVAQFAGLPHDHATVKAVISKCSKDIMADDPRFRDMMVSRHMGWNEHLGRRVRSDAHPSFSKYQLPQYCHDLYEKKFRETFGVGTYDELKQICIVKNEKMLSL